MNRTRLFILLLVLSILIFVGVGVVLNKSLGNEVRYFELALSGICLWFVLLAQSTGRFSQHRTRRPKLFGTLYAFHFVVSILTLVGLTLMGFGVIDLMAAPGGHLPPQAGINFYRTISILLPLQTLLSCLVVRYGTMFVVQKGSLVVQDGSIMYPGHKYAIGIFDEVVPEVESTLLYFHWSDQEVEFADGKFTVSFSTTAELPIENMRSSTQHFFHQWREGAREEIERLVRKDASSFTLGQFLVSCRKTTRTMIVHGLIMHWGKNFSLVLVDPKS